MRRPSKFRVLLAVNRWRITHGKRPIFRLPKGTPCAPSCCPLTLALGASSVTRNHVYPTASAQDHERLSKALCGFRYAFDRGAYPELIA